MNPYMLWLNQKSDFINKTGGALAKPSHPLPLLNAFR